MTDLDDLKARWVDHDRKLDASLRLNRRLLDAVALAKARSAMGRLRAVLAVELVFGIVAPLWLGAFTWEHLDAARFAVPGAVLLAGAIAALHGTIRQLVATDIDPASPITTSQRKLETLRRLRGTCVRWTLLLAPVAWTPLVVVALKGVWDVDAWAVLDVPWLVSNLAVTVAIPVVALWASRRFAARWRGSPRLAWLMDELSGRGLAAAARALDAISAFEAEATEAT